MSYDPSINKTDKLDLTPNNHIDNNSHPVDSGLNATNDFWGAQLANVTPAPVVKGFGKGLAAKFPGRK